MKIFILDDNPIRLTDFRKNLIGHIVVTAMTATESIKTLDQEGPFDYAMLDHDLGESVTAPSGPGTGYEVAQWLSQNPEKQPANIIIHSFNPVGARAMASLLPQSKIIPGAWSYICLPTDEPT